MQLIHSYRSHLSLAANATHPSITRQTGSTVRRKRGREISRKHKHEQSHHSLMHFTCGHERKTQQPNRTSKSNRHKLFLKEENTYHNSSAQPEPIDLCYNKIHVCCCCTPTHRYINPAPKQPITYPGPDPGELVSCDWDYGHSGLATAICIFPFVGSQVGAALCISMIRWHGDITT